MTIRRETAQLGWEATPIVRRDGAIVYFRMLALSLRSRLGLLSLAFENLISFMVKIALIDGAQGVTRGTLTIFQLLCINALTTF